MHGELLWTYFNVVLMCICFHFKNSKFISLSSLVLILLSFVFLRLRSTCIPCKRSFKVEKQVLSISGPCKYCWFSSELCMIWIVKIVFVHKFNVAYGSICFLHWKKHFKNKKILNKYLVHTSWQFYVHTPSFMEKMKLFCVLCKKKKISRAQPFYSTEFYLFTQITKNYHFSWNDFVST
jgi:hypothetical protein